MKKLYLDETATTKVSAEIFNEMKKYYLEEYGNPSSMHEMGEKALKAINNAREKLSKEINAKPHEIIFTSGGTESDNLAIQGLAKAFPNKKKIIISAIEHAAVMEPCRFLKSQGYKIIKIGVDKTGVIKLDELEKELDNDNKNILLVSIMHVNNIFGTIQDIETIGELCKKGGALFHTDAVQSFGKLDIDVRKMGISLLSASAHKIHGPKGIGFLYLREKIKIKPLIFGGGQENDLRSGTENVPGIMGFAKSLELKKKIQKEKIKELRNKLIEKLEKLGGKISGAKDEKRIYNNIHVFFPGINNETLVLFLSRKGIYVSAGSACDSKKEKEDYVLEALGLDEKERNGSIRITLNEEVNTKDIEFIVKEISLFLKRFKL